MSANIGGLINTLWIGDGNNKPFNCDLVMKNKIRLMSFKLKEQKKIILAFGNLYENE